MEKFSKWRDPATGIQPFLPAVAPSSPVSLAVFPLAAVFGLLRLLLLAVLALLYVLLNTILAPLSLGWVPTAITARLALAVLGYYNIPSEIVNDKRGRIAQAVRGVKKGDVILANWGGWVDVLFYAFRHDPVFLLPVFEVSPSAASSFGRASGTGSAAVLPPPSTGVCVGYTPVPLLSLLARTGSLPPTVPTGEKFQGTLYATLADARRASPRPVLLFPEGTTSNGRALLRFGDGVLAEEVGRDGVVWVKYMRHAAPTALLPSAPCPLPNPGMHLLRFAATLPLPRSAAVRTLHPSSAPSSPSFLPSEILASQPGGLAAARNPRTAWRDACAVVLAETGRARRVVGMGWEEKGAFLQYYEKSRR